MEIRYSRLAKQDLLEIWGWLFQNAGDQIADKMLDRIATRIDILTKHPFSGRTRDDVVVGTRCLVVERWVVFYVVQDERIEIARIVDAARDFQALLKP